MSLRLVPCTIKDAKAFVARHHRHNEAPRSALFAVGACASSDSSREYVAVAIVGRPKARALQDGYTVEIVRLCSDGSRNACSFLYGAAVRAAKALGYRRVYTYTLAEKRAEGLCEFCGALGNQTQHGFGKQACPAVRFDGRNLFWSCELCHRRGERDAVWFTGSLVRILGLQQYGQLRLRSVFGDMDDPRAVLSAASAGRFLIEREAA